MEYLGHKVADIEITDYGIPNLAVKRSRDLTVNGYPVEVKLDILAAKTGNICIEHRSLQTHTAPYYIWVVPSFYKVTKKQLEQLVREVPDVVEIGDDRRKGTLVKIDSQWFKQNFIRL